MKTQSCGQEAPREAASHAHFSNKKQQLEYKFPKLLLELMPCVHLPKKCSTLLFDLASVAHVPKKGSKEIERVMSRAHSWWSDTPLGKAWRIEYHGWEISRFL